MATIRVTRATSEDEESNNNRNNRNHNNNNNDDTKSRASSRATRHRSRFSSSRGDGSIDDDEYEYENDDEEEEVNNDNTESNNGGSNGATSNGVANNRMKRNPNNNNSKFNSTTSNFQERYERLNSKMDPFAMLKELRQMVNEGKISKETYDEIYKLQIQRMNTRRESSYSKKLLTLSKHELPLPSSSAATVVDAALSATSSMLSPHAKFLLGKEDDIIKEKKSKAGGINSSMAESVSMGESGSNNNNGNNKSKLKSTKISRSEQLNNLSSQMDVNIKKIINPNDIEKPMMQGYLYKWAKLSAKHWRKRYFALYSSRLEYFVDEENYNRKRRKGIMWINEDFYVAESLMVNNGNSKSNGFMISDFTKILYLAADVPETKHMWMHTVTKAIRKLQEISEYKNEPVLIGRPSRTPSVISKDTRTRYAEYKRNLMAYDASSPIEVEEKVKRGYVPNFSNVPTIEEILEAEYAEEKEIDEKVMETVEALTIPSNLSEPVNVKRELAETVTGRKNEHEEASTLQSAASSAAMTINATSSPLSKKMSSVLASSSTVTTQMPTSPSKRSSVEAPGLNKGGIQASSNTVSVSSSIPVSFGDSALIEEKLKECRRMVDSLSDKHEDIRQKLAKATAEEAKITRSEEQAIYEAAVAEQKCDDLRANEVNLLLEIERMKQRITDDEEILSQGGDNNTGSPSKTQHSRPSLTPPRRSIHHNVRERNSIAKSLGPAFPSAGSILSSSSSVEGNNNNNTADNSLPTLPISGIISASEPNEADNKIKVSALGEDTKDGANGNSINNDENSRQDRAQSTAQKRRSGWFSSMRGRSPSQAGAMMNGVNPDELVDKPSTLSLVSRVSSLMLKSPTSKRASTKMIIDPKAELEAMNIRLNDLRKRLEEAEIEFESKAQIASDLSHQKADINKIVTGFTNELRELQHNLSSHRDLEARLMKTRNAMRKNATGLGVVAGTGATSGNMMEVVSDGVGTVTTTATAQSAPAPRKSRKPIAQIKNDDAVDIERRVSSTQALQIRKGRQSGTHIIKKMEMAELESELVT